MLQREAEKERTREQERKAAEELQAKEQQFRRMQEQLLKDAGASQPTGADILGVVWLTLLNQLLCTLYKERAPHCMHLLSFFTILQMPRE